MRSRTDARFGGLLRALFHDQYCAAREGHALGREEMRAATRVLAILNFRCIPLSAGKMLFCGGKSAFPAPQKPLRSITYVRFPLMPVAAELQGNEQRNCSRIAGDYRGFYEVAGEQRRPPPVRRDFIEA